MWRFRSRLRRTSGTVLIVVGGLWTLAWGLLWYAMYELAGAEGVGMMAFDWRFVGPTALGVVVVVVGIGLVAVQNGRALWPAIAVLVVVLGGVVAMEWRMSVTDEGPFPFKAVPRGGLIAYSAIDGIRLVRSNGGSSWLVSGTGDMDGPTWSPDGTTLVAAEFDEDLRTYSFAADGSDRTQLPFDAQTTPAWSPDGRRMAVVGGDVQIRVIRHANGAVEAMLPIPGNEPSWSPDGSLIAFQSNSRSDLLQVYLVRPDGSGLRGLTSDRAGAGQNRNGAYSPAWAPDGRRLAFASDRDGDDDIYIVRPDGTGLRKVTRNLVDDSSPSWSPDGRKIVFDRTDYERDRTAIVVVDLTTGAETELAHSDEAFVSEPAWQPASPRHASLDTPRELEQRRDTLVDPIRRLGDLERGHRRKGDAPGEQPVG